MLRLRGADDGETLVEVLVTVILLGMAAVAILAGVQVSVRASDQGRKSATGGAYVRSWAEAIQNYVAANPSTYTPCAPLNSYRSIAPLPPGYASANFTQSVGKMWNPAASPPWTTCTGSPEAQQLTLTVTSPDTLSSRKVNETMTLVIRDPCSGSLPSPC